MKCDKLKDYNIMDIEAMDDERLEKSESGKIQVTRVYIKSEVDDAITELKEKLESVQASAYAESVDAGMRERRLKRALWLARAEKNELLSNYRELDNYMYGLMVAGKRSHYEDYENHADSYNEWTTKLSNAAQVCRVKAEKYK